jgi:hypothetical protein
VTDEEAIDLGARAVACKGWRWLPGMLTLADDHGRAWRVHADPRAPRPGLARLAQETGRVIRSPHPRGSMMPPPDLRDPCTLGGLLALVREAKDDPGWQALNLGEDAWAIEGADYPTEAHALVAALEAAP